MSQPVLSIKGPGKAAIQHRGSSVPSGIIISLSSLSSYPCFPVTSVLACALIKIIFLLLATPLHVSSLAQGPVTRSSPDPGVTSQAAPDIYWISTHPIHVQSISTSIGYLMDIHWISIWISICK